MISFWERIRGFYTCSNFFSQLMTSLNIFHHKKRKVFGNISPSSSLDTRTKNLRQ